MKDFFWKAMVLILAVVIVLFTVEHVTHSRRLAVAQGMVDIAQYGKKYLIIDGNDNICQEITLQHNGEGFKISFQQKVVGQKGGDGRVYVKTGSSDMECYKTLEAAIYYHKN